MSVLSSYDIRLAYLKSIEEHHVCVNFKKCQGNGDLARRATCKKFRNKYWGELASFVTREFIFNGGGKQ